MGGALERTSDPTSGSSLIRANQNTKLVPRLILSQEKSPRSACKEVRRAELLTTMGKDCSRFKTEPEARQFQHLCEEAST
jgi:hypothetical protein